MRFRNPFSTNHRVAESSGSREAVVSMRLRFSGPADLQTQLEDILGEVWRQETFERTHPFTCGVIRETGRPEPRRPA